MANKGIKHFKSGFFYKNPDFFMLKKGDFQDLEG